MEYRSDFNKREQNRDKSLSKKRNECKKRNMEPLKFTKIDKLQSEINNALEQRAERKRKRWVKRRRN